jgi:hypothetical protein
MAERWSAKDWREAIEALRAICPTPMPVSVRRVPMPALHYGDCTKEGKRFRVRVAKDARMHEALLILCHEWAHAMVWDLQTCRDPHHDEHWGIALARCYRAVFPSNL